MTRVYLEHTLATGQVVTLHEDASRHLVQVLRMREGDAFTAFNGHGGEYAATVQNVSKRGAQAFIGVKSNVDRESPLDVTLAQCVSKGERMDYTLQKVVELGVTHVVPLLSERSVVKLDVERWEKKLEHWRGVIISACEQSGRTRIPSLQPAHALLPWLMQTPAQSLKLTLAPGAAHKLHETTAPERPVILLVGPEGGLSENEIERSLKAGFIPLSLGPRILRTETAGVAALAMLQSQWGDLD